MYFYFDDCIGALTYVDYVFYVL